MADQTDWNNTESNTGWYVVDKNVTINNRIIVTGTVNLILCDGAKLIASKGITVEKQNTFNINGQIGQTGTLLVDAVDDFIAGIGGIDRGTNPEPNGVEISLILTDILYLYQFNVNHTGIHLYTSISQYRLY